MVVGFTTTCAISAYRYAKVCVQTLFKWWGVLDTLYDIYGGDLQQVWFSVSTHVFLHQWNWLPRYNRNIVESGIKHWTKAKTQVYNINCEVYMDIILPFLLATWYVLGHWLYIFFHKYKWDTRFICSRVCKNTHGIIRKYGLNMCRRCFREYADDIGFRKVN
jgi:small subunit ribosomal protein S29e